MGIDVVKNHRIGILDGFRAIAIMLVICFHYFSRWTPELNTKNFYPYGDTLAHFIIFSHGYLGVQLFFMISGFVISLTLLQSKDWTDFAWKRFSRLFPSMLLCSILIYVLIDLLPLHEFPKLARNFLPSLTFTDPVIWSRFFGEKFSGMDGAYWSLFIEVKFYFWICVLFFLSGGPLRFLPNLIIGFSIIETLNVFGLVLNFPHLVSYLDFIFISQYLTWFMAGIGFYFLYIEGKKLFAYWLIVESGVILLLDYFLQSHGDPIELVFATIFYLLFMIFIFRPKWIALFAWKPLTLIGSASYSLYLLHQDLGVTLIATLGRYLPSSAKSSSAFIAIGVIIGMTFFSLLIYRHWEMPAKRFILSWQPRKTELAPAQIEID